METTLPIPIRNLSATALTAGELSEMGYIPQPGDVLSLHIEVDGMVVADDSGELRLLLAAKGLALSVLNVGFQSRAVGDIR